MLVERVAELAFKGYSLAMIAHAMQLDKYTIQDMWLDWRLTQGF
jgi:hypothetical protein